VDEYPKWIYSREGARIIQDASEYPASGWYESPAFIPDAETAQEGAQEPAGDANDAPTVDGVRSQLEALGIDYDKRWGLARLTALLPA